MIAFTSTEIPRLRSHWRMGLAWVAASTAAILLGFVLLYVLIFAAKVVAPGINEDRLMGWALFPVLGMALGAAQWIILRRRLPRAGWWIDSASSSNRKAN